MAASGISASVEYPPRHGGFYTMTMPSSQCADAAAWTVPDGPARLRPSRAFPDTRDGRVLWPGSNSRQRHLPGNDPHTAHRGYRGAGRARGEGGARHPARASRRAGGHRALRPVPRVGRRVVHLGRSHRRRRRSDGRRRLRRWESRIGAERGRGWNRRGGHVMGTDLHDLSIAELSGLIAARKLSPVELVEALIRRVELYDAQTRAFITRTFDLARQQARQAEAEIAAAGPRGPLHGIPFALKDIYDTRGILTSAHSRIFVDRIPTEDATTTRRLYDAGAVLLG